MDILNKYDEELKKIKKDIKQQHKKIAQLNGEMKNTKDQKEKKEKLSKNNSENSLHHSVEYDDFENQ